MLHLSKVSLALSCVLLVLSFIQLVISLLAIRYRYTTPKGCMQWLRVWVQPFLRLIQCIMCGSLAALSKIGEDDPFVSFNYLILAFSVGRLPVICEAEILWTVLLRPTKISDRFLLLTMPFVISILMICIGSRDSLFSTWREVMIFIYALHIAEMVLLTGLYAWNLKEARKKAGSIDKMRSNENYANYSMVEARRRCFFWILIVSFLSTAVLLLAFLLMLTLLQSDVIEGLWVYLVLSSSPFSCTHVIHVWMEMHFKSIERSRNILH